MRRALLIGIGEYGVGVSPLPQAIRDVEALERVLLDPELGGFSRENVTTLKNPDYQEMGRSIIAFFSKGQKDDLTFFYFSGHGYKDDSNNFHLTSSNTAIEADPTFQYAFSALTAISSVFLSEESRKNRANMKVFIFDCCFSGALTVGSLAKDVASIKAITSEDIKDKLSGKGIALLTSCAAHQSSYVLEQFDLSIYTHHLVKGIETGSADIDCDGFIMAGELHEYATREVSRILQKQTPEFHSVDEGRSIVLTQTSPKTLKETFRKKVRDLLQRRQNQSLKSLDQKLVDTWRDAFNLTNEEANRILQEELNPSPEPYKFQQYRETLKIALKEEGFPFSEQTRETLLEMKGFLKLSDGEVHQLETEVLPEIPAPLPMTLQDTEVFAGKLSITEVTLSSGEYAHLDKILSLAITPDSQTIVSSSADNTIKLWNLNGELIRVLEGHTNWVRSLVISPDGQTLVSGSTDKTIKIWNLNSGKLVQTLEGKPAHWVWTVAMTSDGKTVISGSADKTIRVWDINTGKLIRTIKSHEKIRGLDITSDGKTLVSGSEEGAIRLWDMISYEPITALLDPATEVTSGKILSIAISPSELVIASGSSDETIRLWDIATRELKVAPLSGYSDEVSALAFTSSGQTIIGGSADSTIKLWDTNNGNLIRSLEEHSSPVLCLAVSSDSRTIVSGSADGCLKIWKFS